MLFHHPMWTVLMLDKISLKLLVSQSTVVLSQQTPANYSWAMVSYLVIMLSFSTK